MFGYSGADKSSTTIAPFCAAGSRSKKLTNARPSGENAPSAVKTDAGMPAGRRLQAGSLKNVSWRRLPFTSITHRSARGLVALAGSPREEPNTMLPLPGAKMRVLVPLERRIGHAPADRPARQFENHLVDPEQRLASVEVAREQQARAVGGEGMGLVERGYTRNVLPPVPERRHVVHEIEGGDAHAPFAGRQVGIARRETLDQVRPCQSVTGRIEARVQRPLRRRGDSEFQDSVYGGAVGAYRPELVEKTVAGPGDVAAAQVRSHLRLEHDPVPARMPDRVALVSCGQAEGRMLAGEALHARAVAIHHVHVRKTVCTETVEGDTPTVGRPVDHRPASIPARRSPAPGVEGGGDDGSSPTQPFNSSRSRTGR